MRKTILLLAVGIAAGYFLGFRDAQVNKVDVVTRMVNVAGGSTRGAVSNDVDKQMEQVEKQ